MKMKMSKLLSIVLVMALTLSLAVAAIANRSAQAAEASAETFTPDETVTSAVPAAAQEKIQKAAAIQAAAATLDFSGNYCPACGPDVEVTWTKLTRAFPGTNHGTTPNWTDTHPHFYWDPADFTDGTASYVGMNWLQNTKGADVCIHLNGMRFENSYARMHWGGGTLNIMGEGTFINSGRTDKEVYGIFQISGTATVNLYGGTFIGSGTGLVKPSSTTSYYATVGLNNKAAVVNMYDGVVLSVNENDTQGTSVAVASGTFNMYGGEITGGKGYPYYDEKVVTSGTTEAIKASYDSFATAGGNVFMRNSTAKFNMYGGKITGGNAPVGGNIAMYDNAAFTQYAGEISGGVATSTTEGQGGGNVKLQSGTFTQNGGVIQNGTAAYGGNIDTRSKLYIKGLVKDGIATKSASNMLVASGTQTYIQTGARVLRGSGSMNIMVYGSGKLYIQDGLIYGGYSPTHGGNIYLSGNGTLQMTGGVVRDGETAGDAGNIFSQNKDSIITISGGEVLNGKSGRDGGNIRTTQGQLTITGGTISGGEAARNGGNIYYYASTASDSNKSYGEYMLQITGGTISGGKAAGTGGNIHASGTNGDRTLNVGTGEAKAVIENGEADAAGGNIYVESIAANIGANAEILNGVSNSADYKGGGNIAFNGSKILTTAGIIKNGKTTNAGGGGNISIMSGASWVMNGGVVANGRTEGSSGTAWGGNLRAYNNDVTINDGLIYGGYSKNSDDSCNLAVLTGDTTAGADLKINGGVIVGRINTSGATDKSPATNIVLTGSPKIVKMWKLDDGTTTYGGNNGLRIVSGNTADISGLKADASICVYGTKAGQALTTAYEGAAAVQNAFWALAKEYCITEQDGQLFYTAHAKTDIAKTAATCEATGYAANYKYCATCDEYYTENYLAPVAKDVAITAALGHTPGTAVQENVVNATLNAPGSYDEVVYCSVCDEELSRTEKEIAQLTGAKASINGWFYATLEEAAADVKTGETIVLLADATVSEPVVIPTATLDLNGFVLTGDVVGTVMINGGGIVANGQPFIGNGAYAYMTSDAILLILPEDITVANGTVTVVATLPGLPSAKLTIAEAANLVIAQGVTLNVHGNMIANGNITNNGTIALIRTGATVQTAQSLEVITTVGDTVLYKDGIYSVHTHTEVVDAAVAPTCENTGLTEGKHCDVCGEVLVAQEEISALGHNYVGVQTKAPSCTEKGVMTYTCANDASHTYTEEIDMIPHTEVTDAAVAPTCENTGLTEGKHCDVCGEVLVAQEEVAKLGHNYVGVQTKAPSCTEKGVMTYTCANDASHTYTEEIDMIPHTEVVDAAVAPDCENTGLTEGKHCDVCGEVLVAQEEVAKLGHNYVGTQTQAPTCTETGVKTYTCANDASHTYTEEIAATGHNIVLLTPAEKPANCVTPGKAAVYTCTVCGCYFEDAEGETEQDSEAPGMIFPDGHELTFVAASEATCTKEGNVAHYLCTVCGNAYATDDDYASEAIQTVIPTTGHTAGETVIENQVEATLNAPGSYDEVVYCSVCGAEMSRETKEIPQLTGAVAEINGYYYATFAEAMEAAEAGQTVTLLKPIVVAAGETLELDLKGVTVAYESNVPGEDMITVRGNLVISDSVGGGKLTYANTDATASNVTVSTISAEPGSTVVMNGGTVENKSVRASGSSIYPFAIDILTNGNLGDVTVTINGGTVYSDYMAIRQFNNGTACKNTLTVNGGHIYGASRAIQVHLKNNAAYTTISGGTIEAGGYSLCLFPTDGTNITITGGTFIGDVYSGTEGIISGGNFDRELYAGYCAEGFVPVENENGTYDVVEDSNVAKIGDVKYETVEAALAAAQPGDTIVMIADSDESASVLLLMNGVKLDLNGKELKVMYLITTTGASVVTDSTEGEGVVIMAKNNLTMVSPACMPIWDAEVGGYRFVTVGMYIHEADKNADVLKLQYWFTGAFDGDMKQHLAKVAENDLKVVLRVDYTTTDGSAASLDIVVPAEKVVEYANTAYQPYFVTTIHGLNDLGNAKITVLTTYGNIEIAGATYDYETV